VKTIIALLLFMYMVYSAEQNTILIYLVNINILGVLASEG